MLYTCAHVQCFIASFYASAEVHVNSMRAEIYCVFISSYPFMSRSLVNLYKLYKCLQLATCKQGTMMLQWLELSMLKVFYKLFLVMSLGVACLGVDPT